MPVQPASADTVTSPDSVRRRFLGALGAGALISLVAAGSLFYLLGRSERVTFDRGVLTLPAGLLGWVNANLGASLPVFAVLFAAFVVTLGRLRQGLDANAPIERILQLDHLADTWTALFFGTGVIWTAIGMRSALIFALADAETSVRDGAFAVLQRLVDGGILLALSTTIVGGVGGYLMRVWKSVALGSELQQRYDRAARVDTSSMRAALQRIEGHLRRSRAGGGEEPR